MAFGPDAPQNWFGIPEADRATRADLTDAICIIDETEFYIRGCVEIRVRDSSKPFVWVVWVSVSQDSFHYIVDRWNSPDLPIPQGEPPRFGWLSNWIEGYPEPTEIRCHVFLRSGNMRPRIVLQPTDYPLAVEQRHGITLDRVKEIAAGLGHL
jgi:hypothetical protein